MNWEAIGAVGEVVGAAAVFATLVYFAIQIRQNNRNVETTLQTMRLGAADATVAGFARYRELLAKSEIAELFVKGSKDYNSLSETEQIQFGVVLEEYMFAYWSLFNRVQEGAYDEVDWRAHMNSLRSHMYNPGVRSWWDQRKTIFSPIFVHEIDEQMSVDQGDG